VLINYTPHELINLMINMGGNKKYEEKQINHWADDGSHHANSRPYGLFATGSKHEHEQNGNHGSN
jgi:hypothetical protein